MGWIRFLCEHFRKVEKKRNESNKAREKGERNEACEEGVEG